MSTDITMDDIPRINTVKINREINPEKDGLAIVVDGHEGYIFEVYESENGFPRRERIVIVFKNPHPDFGKEFITKYYGIEKPGYMHWGGGDDMRLERIE